MPDKKLITAPDTDMGDHFKVLLVDFQWPEIQAVAQAVQKLPGKISVFAYGSNDADAPWCINTANHVDCILINMLHQGNIELIKGILMPRSNCWCYGNHKLDTIYANKTIDMYGWLAIRHNEYQQIGEAHEF